MCGRSNKNGFSLLEILVAITILALLMLGVYSLIDNSSMTQTRVVQEDDRLLQMETACSRFELDFSHLYTPLFFSVPYTPDQGQGPGANASNTFQPKELSGLKNFRPSEKFPAISKKGIPIPKIEQEDKDTIIFMTSIHQRKVQDAKQSNYAWVKYSLRTMEQKTDDPPINTDANQEWIRQYSADNPYSQNFNWDNIPTQVLLENVKQLSMQFYDKKKDKYVDNVKDLSGTLPRLLHLTVEWAEFNGTLNESQRYIRVNWPEFDTQADDQELMKAYYEIHKRNEENKKITEGTSQDTTTNGGDDE